MTTFTALRYCWAWQILVQRKLLATWYLYMIHDTAIQTLYLGSGTVFHSLHFV